MLKGEASAPEPPHPPLDLLLYNTYIEFQQVAMPMTITNNSL